MNKKILGIVAAAAVVLVGGAFLLKGGNNNNAPAEDITKSVEITHTLGTTVINETPKNVVVLDLGALDVLDKMDANIVGVPTGLPDYLGKYASDEYATVGSVKEPDLEAINELNPDLIVMSGRMSDFYEDFSEIAPTLYVASESGDYLGSFESTVENYGKIFDKEEMAAEMIAEVKEKAEEVNAKVKEVNENALLLMVNGRGISSFGKDSRFSLLFNEAGFAQADTELVDSTHGQEVTFEYVLENNPGYIFVVDRNSITGASDISAESVIVNELTKQTDAYKNNNIVYLDSVNWYTVSGGYTSTLSMLDEILTAVK